VRIVVNHLTRMAEGFICVAGVDPETRKHVRPVLAGKGVSKTLLDTYGGPYNIGAYVDLGAVSDCGFAPEVEDHQFSPRRATKILDASPARFWAMLQQMSKRNLRAIFGAELDLRQVRGGYSCALPKNKGIASLGCLNPTERPKLWIDPFGKVRALVCDGQFNCSVPVTDLRLYEKDHQTPRRGILDELNKRIFRGIQVILSVGVGQPYQRTGDTVERHWLQVNNFHLLDDPLWRA